MKILLIVLVALFALLVCLAIVILVRAICFKPIYFEDKKEEDISFDKEKAIKSLQELVRCKTVSYYDSSKEDKNEFIKLENKLEELFPLVHKTCVKTKPNERSILYYWKGKSSNKTTVLMAHYDVVPVNEELWEKPPFEGIIENDVLWGRGTIDTKGTLNGIFNAVETLIGNGFVPQNDVYLAFGGNEEINGDGAPSIVKYFESIGLRPDLVIDEGGAIVNNVFPGVSESCAVVGIAEKGMLNVKLSIDNNGGHASTPPQHCSIGKLSKAVVDIENHPFKFTLTDSASKMFDTLGRHSTFLYKIIFANLWLFKDILNKICVKGGGELNALVRTTSAITQMEGSKAINVFPPHASVSINFRLISGETMDSAQAKLEHIINNKEIKIERIEGSMNPSPISKTDEEWDIVKRAILHTWDGVIVSPYLMIACSDSRHYGPISDHVYRFSAMHLSKEERGMIHGNNERIPFDTICKAVEFYLNVIRQI